MIPFPGNNTKSAMSVSQYMLHCISIRTLSCSVTLDQNCVYCFAEKQENFTCI